MVIELEYSVDYTVVGPMGYLLLRLENYSLAGLICLKLINWHQTYYLYYRYPTQMDGLFDEFKLGL